MLKILCVGPQWRGSNAGGLFRALSRIGVLIEIIDENYFINLSSERLLPKVIDKITRPIYIHEFNKSILTKSKLFQPTIILVYKGAFVLPDTLKELKNSGFFLVNFYPDVSFRTHGSYLAKTLPLYDHVFTTKTFGIEDMRNQLGITSSSFIPHGFDPDLHRPINIQDIDNSYFDCDVSFIGGYSLKKAHLLEKLKEALPSISLKIWGPRWDNCKSQQLQSSIYKKAIYGDLYVLGILSSKINLGILHEQVEGASQGDKITSRTFHIPGAGGFLLHERTEESKLYFEEGKEAAFFETPEELISQVKYYLSNPLEREQVRLNGNQRAIKDHSLNKRAELVLERLKGLLNK